MIINRTLNKVISSSPNLQDTLLDLTLDTVAPGNLVKNETAHDNEGESITGRFLTEDAEAWAVGQRNGVPVSSDDITYHNNSKWYSEVSDAASIVAGSCMLIAGEYADNAEESAVICSSILPVVQTNAQSAEANALKSEGHAIGKQNGTDVTSESPYYHNNSKYWAEYARQYAEGGIHYKASLNFANIPTTGMITGDMYDIKDDFTTDNRFEDGAGIECKAGTNIIWNANNKWDIDPQGSGGGGHTILNESGTEMTQRSKLKFMGCDVTDDAENNTTVVAGFDKTANQTLSGNVTFTKRPLVDISGTALTAQTAANILSFKYKNSVSKEKTVNVIRTYGDAENGANNGTVIIGSSSGQTVISSGESAPNVMKTLSEFDDTNEKIYAMSDSGIDIYTNCNTAANAIKAIAIAANGAITLATNAITSLKNALGIGTTDISSVGSTVTGAINNLSTKLLWTNPNPSSTFGSQKITFDTQGITYKLYLIILNDTDAGKPYFRDTIIKNGYGGTVSRANATKLNGGTFLLYIRYINNSDDTSITFGEAGSLQGTGAMSKNNTFLVPQWIYGIN